MRFTLQQAVVWVISNKLTIHITPSGDAILPAMMFSILLPILWCFSESRNFPGVLQLRDSSYLSTFLSIILQVLQP